MRSMGEPMACRQSSWTFLITGWEARAARAARVVDAGDASLSVAISLFASFHSVGSRQSRGMSRNRRVCSCASS